MSRLRAPAVARRTESKDVSPRHREVLIVALDLIAEKGFAGASLRELARRVGVSQPSLYTYFNTKEELIEQIISVIGTELLFGHPPETFPQTLQEIPKFAADLVQRLYREPTYVKFLQFLFNTAPEHPRARDAARKLYGESARAATAFVMSPYVHSGAISADDAEDLVGMITNAIALMLIEHRLLYRATEVPKNVQRYIRFVVRVAEGFVRSPGKAGSATLLQNRSKR